MKKWLWASCTHTQKQKKYFSNKVLLDTQWPHEPPGDTNSKKYFWATSILQSWVDFLDFWAASSNFLDCTGNCSFGGAILKNCCRWPQDFGFLGCPQNLAFWDPLNFVPFLMNTALLFSDHSKKKTATGGTVLNAVGFPPTSSWFKTPRIETKVYRIWLTWSAEGGICSSFSFCPTAGLSLGLFFREFNGFGKRGSLLLLRSCANGGFRAILTQMIWHSSPR